MVFHEKYELLALRFGGEEIALPGREISSGKAVLVHLLAAGYTPENQELLGTMRGLSAEEWQRVLEMGDHDGIPYVVTDSLPGNLSLRNWVKAATAAPPPMTTESLAWDRIATAPVAHPPAADRTSPAGNSTGGPGEFTRMFQPAAVPAASTAAAPAAPAQAPGEFTRLFGVAPKPAGATPTAVSAAETPMPAASNEALPEPEPGELTRLLGSVSGAAPAIPEPPPLVETPATPPAAKGPPDAKAPVTRPATPPEPGGFTELFRAQSPVAPAVAPAAGAAEATRLFQAAPARTPPAAGATGDFTRMMKSPLAPESFQPKAAPPSTEPPGGFTQMLQAGGFPKPRAAEPAPPMSPARTPVPSGESFDSEDEFARIFGPEPPPSDNVTPPPAPQVPLEQGGLATGAFSRRLVPPAPAASSGPSEFTQMFKAPSPPPVAAPKPPTQPVPTQAGLGAKASKSYLPLVLILGGLFLLAVIIILVVTLGH
jgi:hypothetical protein